MIGNIVLVTFSLSDCLLLALSSFAFKFSFYRIIILVLCIVIEAYTVFSSEYILVQCSFQISQCCQYFIVILFLKSKFYVLISDNETFYGHFMVNELIYTAGP